MPTETFTHRSTTPASADSVWMALQSPATWEGIPGVDIVSDPTYDSGGDLDGFRFSTQIAGRSFQGKASRRGRVEGESIDWNITSPDIAGSVGVSLEPVPAGTDITVTLQVSSAGMLSTMFFPAIVRAIGSGFPATVEDFAAGLATA